LLCPLLRADEPPLRIAVTPDSLLFTWPARVGAVEVRELPLHTSAADLPSLGCGH
jgi:hypothetical protein